jgi:hypothetical protein
VVGHWRSKVRTAGRRRLDAGRTRAARAPARRPRPQEHSEGRELRRRAGVARKRHGGGGAGA